MQRTSFNWRRWWVYWTCGTRHRFSIAYSQTTSSLSSAPRWISSDSDKSQPKDRAAFTCTTRRKLFRNISKPSICMMRWYRACNSTCSASVCRQTCALNLFSLSLSSLRRFHYLSIQLTHALRLRIWRGILLRSGATKWRSLRWASRICMSWGKWSRERGKNFCWLIKARGN